MIEDFRKVGFEPISKMPFNTPPQWGQMTLQHMIEHLAILFEVAGGANKVDVITAPEKVEKVKRLFLLSDRELQRNFKAPILPSTPIPYQFNGMVEAITNLKNRITDFENYYKNNPSQTENHPVFGALNYDEWLHFHNKHFTHHFKQFNLI
jgi:hydroxymethylglutaryl-CoA reductase